MVEIIGGITLCLLVWVLASSLATESDAEKRRLAKPSVCEGMEGVEKAQVAA